MTKRNYLIDNQPLDNPDRYWILEETTTLPAAASRKVHLVTIPSLDGSVPVTQGYGNGHVGIAVAVGASNETNLKLKLAEFAKVITNGARLSYEENGKTYTVDILEAVMTEPAYLGKDSEMEWARVGASLTVAPFWMGSDIDLEARVTDSSLTTITDPSGSTESTAPIKNAFISISGPIGNYVSLRNTEDTQMPMEILIANVNIPADQYLYIDMERLEYWTGTQTQNYRTAMGVNVRPIDLRGFSTPKILPDLNGGIFRVQIDGAAGNTLRFQGTEAHL